MYDDKLNSDKQAKQIGKQADGRVSNQFEREQQLYCVCMLNGYEYHASLVRAHFPL